MPETKYNGSCFVFVNSAEPAEYLSPANRRIIRRNATLHRSRAQRRSYIPEEDTTKAKIPSQDPSPSIAKRLSPFPAEIQQHMYSMLAYQATVVGPAIFPFKQLYHYHPTHQAIMCLAIQDAKVLTSTVAVASLWYFRHEINGQSNLKALQATPLQHKQRAIELVRSSVKATSSEIIDPATTISITHLAGLELFIENEEGWQIHMTALKRFSLSEIAKKNDSLVRFSMIEADLIGCYMFDRQPLLYYSAENDGSFCMPSDKEGPEIPSTEEATMRPFSDHDYDAILGKELTGVLQQMRLLSILIDEDPPTIDTEAHVRAFLTSRTAVEHALLRIAHHFQTNTFALATCLTAQIYTNKVFRTFEKNTAIPDRIALRLKFPLQKLMLDNALSSQNVPEILLWMAVMGGVGSRDGTQRAWFVSVLEFLCDAMNLRSWKDLHSQLQRWPWCEKFLRGECEELWSDVEAGYNLNRKQGLKLLRNKSTIPNACVLMASVCARLAMI